MSLVEHFQELRRRLIICVIAVAVGSVVGYIWYQNSLSFTIQGTTYGIPSLGEILKRPYCALPPEKRAAYVPVGEQCRLLATTPLEQLFLRIKVGALAGAVFASPVWLAQIWGFITPGLKKNERSWTRRFVSIAVLLFLVGAGIAYAVVFFGLEFLLGIGSDVQITALTGASYFNLLLTLLLVFGVSFEVPLILVMLNFAGILPYETIKKSRDIIWVLLTIFAAIMTPGQDPFSMTALAIALILLVETALQIMRIHDKRAKAARPEWLDLDDEEASTLDMAPGGVDAPQPVDEASSVDAPGPVSGTARVERPAPIARPENVTKPSTDFGSSPFDDVI